MEKKKAMIMKLEIKSVPQLIGLPHWSVTFDGQTKYFPTHDAAIVHANKVWKRFYKESSAFSMAESISTNLLSIEDFKFVRSLQKTSCKGITPKQYGYLKGIHERQEREW